MAPPPPWPTRNGSLQQMQQQQPQQPQQQQQPQRPQYPQRPPPIPPPSQLQSQSQSQTQSQSQLQSQEGQQWQQFSSSTNPALPHAGRSGTPGATIGTHSTTVTNKTASSARHNGPSFEPNVQRNRGRNPNPMSDFEFLDGSQFLIESSSSDSDFRPKRDPRPQHGRSMSHPFPSLFSGKKKKAGDVAGAAAYLGGSSSDEDGGGGWPKPRPKVPDKNGPLGLVGPTGNEFTTGNCITCGSLVRWPRELDVFKCTICVTINDVKPGTHEPKKLAPGPASGVDTGAGTGAGGCFSAPTARPIQPISVGHTKLLIRQCLHAFLSLTLSRSSRQEADIPFGHMRSLVLADAIETTTETTTATATAAPFDHTRSPVWEKANANAVLIPESVFDGPIGSSAVEHLNSLRRNHHHRSLSPRSYSTSCSDQRPNIQGILRHTGGLGIGTLPPSPSGGTAEPDPKKLFKPLEDYLLASITSWACLSCSFGGARPSNPVTRQTGQAGQVEESRRRGPEDRKGGGPAAVPPPASASASATAPSLGQGKVSITKLDEKLLLLGDFAENGSWWTGSREVVSNVRPAVHSSSQRDKSGDDGDHVAVASRSPGIDWAELDDWYATIVNAGQSWKAVYDSMISGGYFCPLPDADLQRLDAQVLLAQEHAQRALLKATELILRRPGHPITEPHDSRFLLLIFANPLLASPRAFPGHYRHAESCVERHVERDTKKKTTSDTSTSASGPSSGQHSGIIKRILGLISNSSNDCHNQLIVWLARYPESHFVATKDLVSGFLSYRLLRQKDKKQEVKVDVTGGLIPNMSTGRSVATLHAALGHSSGPGPALASASASASATVVTASSSAAAASASMAGPISSSYSSSATTSKTKFKDKPRKILFNDDWQIKAAARVMALIFAANNIRSTRRGTGTDAAIPPQKDRVSSRGQLLPTSDFYVPLLDDSDLLGDFDTWESRRGKFSFCQYPFLLSIWAKIQILEHDAKRQMQRMARDAFFDSIMSRRSVEQYLVLNVRRDCLVEDSLKGVSEVIGSGSEDVKKGLRIAFKGEDGVDAGGLRKEWFLLLVREVFNPDHGMFVYDEDSHYCYFNPNSFETSDQYFLVGVVLGLAIYNSTILDVAFPPFAFRKLLAAAPSLPGAASPAHSRTPMTYTLDDLAEYRPCLAQGLRQLLEYEGDVESTFCLDFVVDIDKYGSIETVPLASGGEARPVTRANRREYVDLYVRYLLDHAVSRQFDPFKRGFFTVCGGNALSLFRPEEIELLVRGSDEALNIMSLRAVAQYDGWNSRSAEDTEPTIQWFWELLGDASLQDQRKLLIFVTGSDRIPAMGATSLVIRLVCLGDDSSRYPTARTCFNTLALSRYGSKERLRRMLWGAVHESEGFGLK